MTHIIMVIKMAISVIWVSSFTFNNSDRRKEGNVLFNDALNTFYLRLYGVRHMVKDHSDSERENPLPPHGLLFPISSKGFFYMHHPTDRMAHTTAFVTPVVEHWLEREIAQWVHHGGSIRRPIATWANAPTTEVYLAPIMLWMQVEEEEEEEEEELTDIMVHKNLYLFNKSDKKNCIQLHTCASV